MEFLTPLNNRLDFATQATDAKSIVIRDKYGTIQQFIQKFNIDKQEYCALELEKAIRSGVPSLVSFGKAYGETQIVGLLEAHVYSVIAALGENEKLGEQEAENIAKSIWLNPRARTLSLPSVLSFFFYAKIGHFKLYAGKARNFIEAFNDFLQSAIDTEYRIKYAIEKEERKAEEEKWLKERIPYEQSEHYKRTHESNPLVDILKKAQ